MSCFFFTYVGMWFINNGPGYLRRYSDSLRAGWSWDRIPVGAKFFAPFLTVPEAHPGPYIMGTGSFPGVNGRVVALNTHPISAEVKEWVEPNH